MNKYFILVILLTYSFTYSQEVQTYLDIPQDHDIFYYWDMDKYPAKDEYPKWHDMDFKCNPKEEIYENYWWKLTLTKGSISYSTDIIKIEYYKTIYPYWDTPNGSGDNYLHLPNHFEPENYTIQFYDENKDEVDILKINNHSIDLYDTYLYDEYHNYNSKINSFSASLDLQSGNIILFADILQPERFYLTVKVNGTIYPDINESLITYTYSTDWERIKTLEDLQIENAWLVQNNLVGQLNIELILKSSNWYYDHFNTSVSGTTTYSVNNNPTPTISMSGGFGDNPTLTFSGGGPNVDHYILKKEYDFGSGFYPHYVNPASNPFTDTNVEINRFNSDVVARYSVKVVGPNGIESSYSNTVSTDARSVWKKSNEDSLSNHSTNYFVDEYGLNTNYPNPFNPNTQISYQIPKYEFVNLVVYNSLGQKVAELVKEYQTKGKYSVRFNANNLPSGIYYYKLQAGEFNSIKKMILAK